MVGKVDKSNLFLKGLIQKQVLCSFKGEGKKEEMREGFDKLPKEIAKELRDLLGNFTAEHAELEV